MRDIEQDWQDHYSRLCGLLGITIEGSHFMLVPAGMDVDSRDWQLLHGETMTAVKEFELERGHTVEDLAAHLRKCLPGAEVQPPAVVGRMDVRKKD